MAPCVPTLAHPATLSHNGLAFKVQPVNLSEVLNAPVESSSLRTPTCQRAFASRVLVASPHRTRPVAWFLSAVLIILALNQRLSPLLLKLEPLRNWLALTPPPITNGKACPPALSTTLTLSAPAQRKHVSGELRVPILVTGLQSTLASARKVSHDENALEDHVRFANSVHRWHHMVEHLPKQANHRGVVRRHGRDHW